MHYYFFTVSTYVSALAARCNYLCLQADNCRLIRLTVFCFIHFLITVARWPLLAALASARCFTSYCVRLLPDQVGRSCTLLFFITISHISTSYLYAFLGRCPLVALVGIIAPTTLTDQAGRVVSYLFF